MLNGEYCDNRVKDWKHSVEYRVWESGQEGEVWISKISKSKWNICSRITNSLASAWKYYRRVNSYVIYYAICNRCLYSGG